MGSPEKDLFRKPVSPSEGKNLLDEINLAASQIKGALEMKTNLLIRLRAKIAAENEKIDQYVARLEASEDAAAAHKILEQARMRQRKNEMNYKLLVAEIEGLEMRQKTLPLAKLRAKTQMGKQAY